MNHSLKLWAGRSVSAVAALALVIAFAGFAQAHDDEDYDDDYAPPVHDWHAGPHVGPHEGCHWSPDYGYHCGPHVGVHSGVHHDWYQEVPYYRYPGPYDRYPAPSYRYYEWHY